MKTPTEYIKEAWKIYTKRDNFIFFARIMAVLTLVSAGLAYAGNYFSWGINFEDVTMVDFSNVRNLPLAITAFVFANLYYFYSESTAYVSVINLKGGLLGKEKEMFIMGYKKMWKFLITSLSVGLIVVVGLILLIIPGIIFSIWYSQTLYLVVDKNIPLRQALTRSKAMVVGVFWKVLGRFFVFGLFSAIVGMLVGIMPYIGTWIAGFLTPLFILPFFLLYSDLAKSKV
jgi:hypothetical protein